MLLETQNDGGIAACLWRCSTAVQRRSSVTLHAASRLLPRLLHSTCARRARQPNKPPLTTLAALLADHKPLLCLVLLSSLVRR